MTTATRDDRTLGNEPGPAATSIAPPPKLRRRPAMVAAAIAAICLGALLAGWAWTATSSTQEVLAARHHIERGAVIEAGDLVRVQLNADPALDPVPGDDLSRVVGQRAGFDIARGGLLTPEAFSSTVVPAAGQSVVGVALTPAQVPGVDLRNGDQVRIIATPAENDTRRDGSPAFNDAEVVGVTFDETTGLTVVDLLVPDADAAVLATRVATGNVALVLDSRER